MNELENTFSSEQKEEGALSIKKFDGFDLYKNFSNLSKETVDVFEKYEKLKEEGKHMSVTFSLATKRGTPYVFDNNNVQIRLMRTSESVDIEHLPFSVNGWKLKKNNKWKLGEQYDVTIEKIDRENNVVYVKRVHISEEREKLISALIEGINTKEYVRVPAVVLGFTGVSPITGEREDTVILLNIANLGIFGAVRKMEWSPEKIKMIRNCIQVGDVIEVAVKKVSKWASGELFDCSRKDIMLADNINPWKDIEQKVPEKTRVKIKCVELRQNHFFSVIDGLKEIEVLCEYPKDRDVEIVVGQEYRGLVYRVSEAKKKLCVRVLEKVE